MNKPITTTPTTPTTTGSPLPIFLAVMGVTRCGKCGSSCLSELQPIPMSQLAPPAIPAARPRVQRGPAGPMPDLLTPGDLAERWGLHQITLANWRVKGKGPKFMKAAKDIRYAREDVLEWEKQHKYLHNAQRAVLEEAENKERLRKMGLQPSGR